MQRPSDAQSALKRLGETTPPEVAARAVGRLAERARLAEALRALVDQSVGSAFLVCGESGAGKTSLVHEVLRDSVPILHVKFLPNAEILSGLSDLCTQISRWAATRARLDSLRHAAGAIWGFLVDCCPELRRATQDAGLSRPTAEESVDPGPQRATLVVDFLEQFARLHGPLALWVDDIPWADAPTLEILRELAVRSSGVPRVLLATARVADVDDELRTSFASGIVSLAPLGDEEVCDLIARMLPGRPASEELTSAVVERAAGSPLFVVEYLQALLEHGCVWPTRSVWQVDAERTRQVALSGDLGALIAARLRKIDPSTRELVTAVAVGGNHASLQLLQDVLGEHVVTSVDAAWSSGVLSLNDGMLSFVHDKLREGVLASLPADERASLHDRYARALSAKKYPGVTPLSLADHCVEGTSPQASSSILLEAGSFALANFAPVPALRYFGVLAGDPDPATAAKALCGLGDAYRYLKRPRDALRHYHEVRARTSDASLLAHVFHGEARSFHANYEPERAWESFQRAMVASGKRFYSRRLPLLASILSHLVQAVGLHYVYGMGSASGHRGRMVEAELYETGGTVAYWNFTPLHIIELGLRSLVVSLRLGTSRPLVRSLGLMGSVLALAGFVAASRRFTSRALAIAEGMRDPLAVARARAVSAWNAHMAGSPVDAIEQGTAALDEIGHLLDDQDFTNLASDIVINQELRGFWPECFDNYVRAGSRSGFQSNFARACVLRGQFARAAGIQVQAKNELTGRKDDFHAAVLHATNVALAWLDPARKPGDLEEALGSLDALRIQPRTAPFHLFSAFLYPAYATLEQYLRAPDSARTRLFLHHSRRFLQFARSRSFAGHAAVMRAAAALAQGDLLAAEKQLGEAATRAAELDSPWVAFAAERLRAELANRRSQTRAAERIHHAAFEVAARVLGGAVRNLDVLGRYSSRTETRFVDQGSLASMELQRQLTAVLAVSAATASTLREEEQIDLVLTETLKFSKAERAALFVAETHGMQLRAYRERGSDVREPSTPISATVVTRVAASHSAVLLTSAEDGRAIGAHSVVAQDIRSVIAAPILLGSQLFGVLYLDSSVSSGIFDETDLGVLRAVATHVAFAFELAKGARIALAKQAADQELRVGASVQRLLMPAERELERRRLRSAWEYRPASTAGGDWLAVRPVGDDQAQLIIADVTGHGVGAAMVTAVVAATMEAARSDPETTPFELLHRTLREFARGSYCVAATGVICSPSEIVVTGAGSPPIVVMTATKVRLVVPGGSSLGADDIATHRTVIPVDPNERYRVVAFTDGLAETRNAQGRELGLKRILGELEFDVSPARQAERLVALAEAYREAGPQEDDVTVIVFDMNT